MREAMMIVAYVSIVAASALSDTPDSGEAHAADLPSIPMIEVVPQPDHEASFRHHDRELTRYRFGPDLQRPYWFPIKGPGDRSLTRIGHPHGPDHHRHHYSVWIAHQKVDGHSFWEDDTGHRIVCRGVRKYHDGDDAAYMVSDNDWLAGDRVVLKERRRCEVRPDEGGAWFMIVDVELSAPGSEPVELGATPYGMFAVRMAKSIGVADGGGRILDSEGRVGENEVFRKPVRWVDYSGRADRDSLGGISLLDHPMNPSHPTPFHVREDGWMGASLTHKAAITIEPGKPLRLRYGLWVHGGMPDRARVDAAWKRFAAWKLAALR